MHHSFNRFGIIALVLALTLSVGAVYAQSPRYALVIGNSAYAVGPLRNPVNDATDMAGALQKMGFSVALGLDASKKTMYQLIEQFGKDLRGAEIALFYYSGHGVQAEGQNY
ncbi:MAG: peptidase C14 caspase catalytic subunit p20 [Spirochaetes bacterium]|nr:MAG: peptidase C14 caspase catalytic subunit p20 [Spirochaetota bacterium]